MLDLERCDRALISSSEHILRFARVLCDEIGMIAYGDPVCERFALDNPEAAGFTLVQLITTSSISAHFAENTGRAFINVFSCRPFDTGRAATFIAQYFDAQQHTQRVLHRGSTVTDDAAHWAAT